MYSVKPSEYKFPLSCCLTFHISEQTDTNRADEEACMAFKKFKRRENLNTRFTNDFNLLFEKMKESILNKLDVSINDCVQSIVEMYHKVSKVAKIRNRYNQVPHLTQDTNGKVTNSQKTPQTRAKRSALSQQVTTKHI